MPNIPRPEVKFTRRRYGRNTYTWAEVFLHGQWYSLGDPWPSVRVPAKELIAAIARVHAQHFPNEENPYA